MSYHALLGLLERGKFLAEEMGPGRRWARVSVCLYALSPMSGDPEGAGSRC